ncbi:hypothetical protein [Salaquimonas pukyongi]|uniref:hypothetical protein n=1 Tax=Salaquimonas pukyongi TaxID=2712698 RepID=UPI0012EB8701|nr:hypothetical protein [Salaquimonas pukyongi]
MSSNDFFENNRVQKRAAFFSGMAERLLGVYPEIGKYTHFTTDSPILLSHCYFLLSDSYKAARLKPESRTDDYKKAAISATAVMIVRPFAALNPDDVSNLEAFLANPIFAMACGNAWASNRDLFSSYPFDYLKRFYNTLHNVEIHAMEEFIQRLRADQPVTDITSVTLNRHDMAALDNWVEKFFMLCNQKR